MAPSQECSLVWFRNDLRLADNPALCAAAESGLPVIACYILDDTHGRAMGGAMRWWLAQSLRSLEKSLAEHNIPLILQRGNADSCLVELVEKLKAKHVFWNRRYEKALRDLDSTIKSTLQDLKIEAKSFNGALLVEPWEIKPKTAPHYKVFTPFWKNLRETAIAQPLPIPRITQKRPALSESLSLKREELELEPHSPDWAASFVPHWKAGEEEALARLDAFLENNDGYPEDRDKPYKAATSTLSPYLHIGTISPRMIWHTTFSASMAQHGCLTHANEKFLSELVWREFSYHQLYHLPDISKHPVQPLFKHFQWKKDTGAFAQWSKGKTGYPLVDAGMRQLWQTGWMHNRVRMVVASFLIKHLGQDWRTGEQWFWDTLVDADPASNPANWQWVAGCGADAAPFFRVFNPIIQSEKFDPEGKYIRTFLPELADLPAAKIHEPWKLSKSEQQRYGVIIGQDYPSPIVVHEKAREAALSAYKELKEHSAEFSETD